MAASRGHRLILLADEATLADPAIPVEAERRPVRLDRPPSEAAAAGGSRSLRDMLRMSRAAMAVRADVFFFPATYSFVPVPFTRVAVTVHDAIAETMPDLVVPSRLDRLRWSAKQRLALRQAKVIFTVSDAARDDIIRVLKLPADRIRVVNEAAHPRFVPAGAHPEQSSCLGAATGQPYFLYVGGISPHKNLVTLVRAFDRVVADHPDAFLVLAGDLDDDPFLSSAAEVREAIAGLQHGNHVHLTGFVPDEELVRLYQGAVATMLVSHGEGFGLPVAESMACGTPVIASDAPSLRENAGGAATYVDPNDPDQIAKAMGELLANREMRDLMAATGLQRAAAHSWKQAAATVLDVLEETAGR
jgi:glycosyltransferase involved in cell wall biosynthesis